MLGDGGPFMYLLLLVAPLALLGALLPGLAAVRKRRIPTAIPLALVTLPALMGRLGGTRASSGSSVSSNMHRPRVHASAEMRGALMDRAMSGVPGAAPFIGGAVVWCLAAALAHALAVPASRTVRTAIGAGAGRLVVLPTLTMPLLRAGTALRLVQVAPPWNPRRAERLAVDPITLPTSDDDGVPGTASVRSTPQDACCTVGVSVHCFLEAPP